MESVISLVIVVGLLLVFLSLFVTNISIEKLPRDGKRVTLFVNGRKIF